jgi:hypothetical protein
MKDALLDRGWNGPIAFERAADQESEQYRPNVLVVDWDASPSKIQARADARLVGVMVARMLTFVRVSEVLICLFITQFSQRSNRTVTINWLIGGQVRYWDEPYSRLHRHNLKPGIDFKQGKRA